MFLKLGPQKFFSMHKEVMNGKEFKDTVLMILKSDIIKGRLQTGYSEAMHNALMQAEKSGRFAKVLKAGMLVPGLGDAATSSFFGAMYYMKLMKSPEYQAMNKEEAHELAMAELFGLIEATQQSTHDAYMPDLIRRGGSAVKMLTHFQSSLMQQYGFEAKAIREGWAKNHDFTAALFKGVLSFDSDMIAKAWESKDVKSMKDAAIMVFWNHVVLPGLWWGAGQFFKQVILGEEFEDEDWWELVISSLLGPARAIILAGAIAEGSLHKIFETKRAFFGTSSLPADSIKDDAAQFFKTLNSIGGEEFFKELDRMLKMLLRPYAHGRKAFENRSED